VIAEHIIHCLEIVQLLLGPKPAGKIGNIAKLQSCLLVAASV